IEQAIRLNGRSVEANLRAFAAGRETAFRDASDADREQTLDEFVASRTADLAVYWNARYAARYAELLSQVRAAAVAIEGGEAYMWAVARSAYKLMAYKDEYEVARLYSDGRLRRALDQEFEGIRRM